MFVTKRCGGCGEDLPLEAFNRMGAGRQDWCRECFRAYFRARGDLHRRQVALSQRRRSSAARAVIVAHLASHPCVDCGERDIAVLEFDHVLTRRDTVGTLLARGARPERIRSEIARCQVRCANCHRRVTAQRAGWLRARPGIEERLRQLNPTRRRNIRVIFDALRSSGCVDCGERDLVVLEFDHIGPKTSTVMALGWGERSLERIRAEIAVCEVRCCNCHRRRTAEQRRRRAQRA